MSEDEGFEEPSAGKTFEPLKPATTRSEAVDMGATEPAGKTFEPLKATTTRTEAPDGDSTPVVVEDGVDEPDGTLGQLKGEVRGLRSRNQILRAERTSIAGRKYALEVVVESLKEKLEALAALCDQINAPGELGEALAGIREMVGEARAIATGKADALEADLQSERAEQLKKYQAMETKVSELSEQNAGLRAERDALREEAGDAGRQLVTLRAQVTELEAFKSRAMETIDDAVGEGQDQQSKIDALEAEVAELRDAAGRVAEAESAVEALRRDNQDQRKVLSVAEERASDAEQRALALEERARTLEAEAQAAKADTSRVDQLEHDLEQAVRQAEATHDLASRVEVERDTALAAVEEAANKLEKQDATLTELREALQEIKPVLDELDSENRRLARLVGEARDRGRVDINELLAREKLLRKLERLAKGD